MSDSPLQGRWHGHDHRKLRLVTMLTVFDVIMTAAVWVGTNNFMRAPTHLPSGAPIVVFYSDYSIEREARMTTAAEAWERFGQRPVLVVGGARPARDYFGAEDMARQLAALGVDRRDIVSERRSFDTESNITAARALIPDARAVVLVSDALHLVRILALLKTRWPTADPVLYPTHMNVDLCRVWLRVHYEAVAWLSMFVPEHLRKVLLKHVRA